jgi:sortase A
VRYMRFFAVLVFLAGASVTARSGYLHAKAELAAILIRRAWEQSSPSGAPRRPWPWADTYPIARLEIPRLDYDEIVLEGATARALAFGPARLLSGSRPGERGNLVVAGHRTSWFLPLEKLAQGDRIIVEWFDPHGGLRKRTYSADTIRVVEPQDEGLLGPTSQDALTLLTCYPFGYGPGSPQRYVVRAWPLEASHLIQR